MTDLGQHAKRIDRAARDLALRSDADVSLRDALHLISALAAIVTAIDERPLHGHTDGGEAVTVRP